MPYTLSPLRHVHGILFLHGLLLAQMARGLTHMDMKLNPPLHQHMHTMPPRSTFVLPSSVAQPPAATRLPELRLERAHQRSKPPRGRLTAARRHRRTHRKRAGRLLQHRHAHAASLLPRVDAPALGCLFQVGAATLKGRNRVRAAAATRQHAQGRSQREARGVCLARHAAPPQGRSRVRVAAAARQRIQGCGEREARSVLLAWHAPPPQGCRQRAQQLRRAIARPTDAKSDAPPAPQAGFNPEPKSCGAPSRGPLTLYAMRRLRHKQVSLAPSRLLNRTQLLVAHTCIGCANQRRLLASHTPHL